MRSSLTRRHALIISMFVITLAALSAMLIAPKGRWLTQRALAFATQGRSLPAPDFTSAKTRLARAAGSTLKLPLTTPRVVIHKKERKAELFDGDKLIKTYHCALGGQPEGDKVKKGDGRTPEGTYFICQRNGRSQLGLFMGLNYPTAEDAERGLKSHLINQTEYKEIISAEARHKCPPWLTGLGGAVGLHGGGTASDWTRGCIAFDEADTAEIWLATGNWTPVEIRP